MRGYYGDGEATRRAVDIKIPHYIWFVDEFPMTVTGKSQKFRMRELAMEKLRASTTD